MNDYKVFIDFDIFASIKSIRSRRKQELVHFLHSLETDPFQAGDLQTEQEGRIVQVKVFGKYSLLYWPDHAVREIKVIDFYQSSRA